jgi:Flp pilus assembly protein CpaB
MFLVQLVIFGDKNYKKLGPVKSKVPSILFKSSVILAFIFLLINYVENIGSQKVKTGDFITIYLTNSTVNKYARIKEDILEEFLIPKQYTPSSLSISRTQILGSYASRMIEAGEVISKYAVLPSEVNSNKEKDIAYEHRLVFVPINEGIISYIKPGDKVDLFFTINADGFNACTTERIFDSIEVFATEGKGSIISSTSGEDQIFGDVIGGEAISDLGSRGLILIIPKVGIERLFFAMASGRIDVALVPEI